MAQTTAAIGGTNCKVEMLVGAVWTDVSGSTNQVTGTEQRRMSGEAYTFDGDTAIVKGGKREPVEIGFKMVYTEEAAETWEIVRALFETAGGGPLSIRWTPEVGSDVNTIAAGVVTRLQYPQAEATDANPVTCEFSVKAGFVTVA